MEREELEKTLKEQIDVLRELQKSLKEKNEFGKADEIILISARIESLVNSIDNLKAKL